MTNPKDERDRKTPDESEFLGRQGWAWHKTGEKYGMNRKPALLGCVLGIFALIGIAALVAFLYVNRR